MAPTLHDAVQRKDFPAVREFLAKDVKSVNSLDGDERTPIFWACSSGNAEIAQFLLEKGADVNAKDDVC